MVELVQHVVADLLAELGCQGRDLALIGDRIGGLDILQLRHDLAIRRRRRRDAAGGEVEQLGHDRTGDAGLVARVGADERLGRRELQLLRGGELGQRLIRLDLIGQHLRLVGDLLGALLVGPGILRLVLDRVERLQRRSGDAVGPYQIERTVRDLFEAAGRALVGGEGGLDQRIRRNREFRQRLAVRILAALVGGLDHIRRQLELLGDRGQIGAGGHRILDLVRQCIERVGLGILACVGFEQRLHFLEALAGGGVDLGDLDDVPAEGSLDRLQDLAGLGGEHGIGELGRQVLLGEVAQIDRCGIGLGQVLGQLDEILALGQLRLGCVGGRLILEDHLQHMALFGLHELVLALVIGILQRRIVDFHVGRDVLGRQRQRGETAIFRCGEDLRMLVVIGLQRRVVGRRDILHRTRRQKHPVGDALFIAHAIERFGQRLGCDDRAAGDAGEIDARLLGAQQGDIGLLGIAGLGECYPELAGIELTRGVLECRLLLDQQAHFLVADQQMQALGLLVEHRLGHQPVNGLIDDTEGLGLLDVEIAAELLAQPIDLFAHGLLHDVAGDLVAADGRHGRVLRRGAQEIANAPDAEAQDKKHEQDLYDESPGF